MSKAERKLSVSYADAQKRSSYEETPEGRPARRRAEEKMPATSQPFLSIPSLYRFEGLPDNGKASSLLPCQRDGRRPHLENCTGKRASKHSNLSTAKPPKRS